VNSHIGTFYLETLSHQRMLYEFPLLHLRMLSRNAHWFANRWFEHTQVIEYWTDYLRDIDSDPRLSNGSELSGIGLMPESALALAGD